MRHRRHVITLSNAIQLFFATKEGRRNKREGTRWKKEERFWDVFDILRLKRMQEVLYQSGYQIILAPVTELTKLQLLIATQVHFLYN